MLAITRDGRRGYTSNVGPSTVSVLDLEAKKLLAVIPVSATERAQLKLDVIALRVFYSSAEMPKAIKDEFTDLPVSHQRKSQLRMQRDGRCIICGESAVGPFFCLRHLVKSRERMRRRIGAKKRLKGARSYRLEREVKAARRRTK